MASGKVDALFKTQDYTRTVDGNGHVYIFIEAMPQDFHQFINLVGITTYVERYEYYNGALMARVAGWDGSITAGASVKVQLIYN